MARTEWSKGHRFAEVAETLGVPTDHIMGTVGNPALPSDLPLLVLYTPKLEGDNPPVMKAVLNRDADDILVVVGEPEVVPDFYERLRSIMDAAFAEKDPENDGGGE